MKLAIFAVTEGKEAWLSEVEQIYSKKLKHFCEFSFVEIKPFKEARAQNSEKIKKESQEILKKIDDKDYVILCDVLGKEYSSETFAEQLNKKYETFSGRRFVFIIGGAYGVGDEIKQRAQEKLKLSTMTYNHHVALTVLLEQLYRAFTIQKGIPYHNG